MGTMMRSPVARGMAVPPLELVTVSGKSISLTGISADKVLLLFYRGHW